jgi:hypothetical protein
LEKLAFTRCDNFVKKGSSSWQEKCTVSGRTVTTNANKKSYGHYLQTEAGIVRCLDKERLREVDRELIEKLEAR